MSGLGTFLKRLKLGDGTDAPPDVILLRRFVEHHDPAAFETIVRRHGTLVLRVCQRELPRLSDAEDAFQATFLVLAQKARYIRHPDALPGWLSGVARRLSRRLARRLRKERERLIHFPRRPTATQPTGSSWWDEERRRLPEEYRTVVDLCLIQGLTRDEAARCLGQSPGAVHGLLYRARLKLKKQLLDSGAVVGSFAACSQATGAVIDRLAPTLAAAAVQHARNGRLAGEILSANALWLARSGSAGAWINPVMLVGGCILGLATATAYVQFVSRQSTQPELPPQENVNSLIIARPALLDDFPVQQQQEQIRPERPTQTLGRQQHAQQGTSGSIRPQVPPADQVPTASQQTNLAKSLVAASGMLHADLIPRLPNVQKLAIDGRDVIISVITTNEEYRNCRPTQPARQQSGVQTASDPAWDGSLFQTKWSEEVLVVVTILHPSQSVGLTPLTKPWIPPDDQGVGHLLLSYAGADAAGKGSSHYPYVMVKVPRAGLQRVAVTIWRPTERPTGVATIPPPGKVEK